MTSLFILGPRVRQVHLSTKWANQKPDDNDDDDAVYNNDDDDDDDDDNDDEGNWSCWSHGILVFNRFR